MSGRHGRPRHARAIDAIDRALLAAVNRRLELVRQLHEHKVANGMPLRDPGREEAIVASLQDGERRARSPTRASPSSSRFVLDLTRSELHGE